MKFWFALAWAETFFLCFLNFIFFYNLSFFFFWCHIKCDRRLRSLRAKSSTSFIGECRLLRKILLCSICTCAQKYGIETRIQLFLYILLLHVIVVSLSGCSCWDRFVLKMVFLVVSGLFLSWGTSGWKVKTLDAFFSNCSWSSLGTRLGTLKFFIYCQ